MLHPCELFRKYDSPLLKQERASEVGRAAEALKHASELHSVDSDHTEGKIKDLLAGIERVHDRLKPYDAMLAVDALAERVRRQSKDLDKECFEPARFGRNRKRQLVALWLCTWVRQGMHPDAVAHACNDACDAVAHARDACNDDGPRPAQSRACSRRLCNFLQRCSKAKAEWVAAHEAIDKRRKAFKEYRRRGATSPSALAGSRCDEAYSRILELQREWFTTMAPHGEVFNPDKDYVGQWRRICTAYQRQARRERRRTRGAHEAGSATTGAA